MRLKKNLGSHYRANSIQIARFENKCLKHELFLLVVAHVNLGSANCTVAGALIEEIFRRFGCSVPSSMIQGFPTQFFIKYVRFTIA